MILIDVSVATAITRGVMIDGTIQRSIHVAMSRTTCAARRHFTSEHCATRRQHRRAHVRDDCTTRRHSTLLTVSSHAWSARAKSSHPEVAHVFPTIRLSKLAPVRSPRLTRSERTDVVPNWDSLNGPAPHAPMLPRHSTARAHMYDPRAPQDPHIPGGVLQLTRVVVCHRAIPSSVQAPPRERA